MRIALSVDDSAVSDMLRDFNVNMKSAIKYENIRDPITHHMTNVLNCNRFLYIDPLPQGKSLPSIATFAKLKCRKYIIRTNFNPTLIYIVTTFGRPSKGNNNVRMRKFVESVESVDTLPDPQNTSTTWIRQKQFLSL